jgi:hypothetical protein
MATRSGLSRAILGVILVATSLPGLAETPRACFFEYRDDEGRAHLVQPPLPEIARLNGYVEYSCGITPVPIREVPPARPVDVACLKRKEADLDLLLRYDSVAALDADQARKLRELHERIRLIESLLLQNQRTLADTRNRAADYERRDQPVPQTMQDVMRGYRQQIAELQDEMDRVFADVEVSEQRFKDWRARLQRLLDRSRPVAYGC